MISWIQRYFQQHFKTIFAILLAITIVSFIFTIGAPGIGQPDRKVVDRPFFGYNLAQAQDQQRMMADAMTSANLQMGSMAGLENEQLQQFAFQRAAALSLANQWHIPEPTRAEVSEAVKKLRMFTGPNGEFDAKAYTTFRENLKKNPNGGNEAEIARIIADDVRTEKVQKLIAGPGYILPREVKSQLERSDTTWNISTATADFASFKPEIKPTDADLTKYFEETAMRYEIPARIVASYIEFPSSQFVPQVNVTDADVRAYYDMNPARFPKPPQVSTDGKPPAASTPDADFAAVRQQVQAALILEKAQKLAVKAASDVAVALFEARVPNPQAVDAVLAPRKLQQKTLAPFTHEAGPAELGHSPEIAEEAFKLNKEHFLSDAVPSPTGAVILVWRDLQPPRKPQLSEVKEKVTADYIQDQRQKRFIELGKTARTQIEARLKAGDSFEKAVAAAASATGLKLEAKTLAPFTLRTRPQDVDYSVIAALDRMNKGDVSDLQFSGEKGIFIYAADKKLPNLSETSPEFIAMRDQMAAMSGRIAANAVITELVDRELKRSEPKVD
jgi:peptidyl-prolyl cis-trans isomerase D